MLKYLEFLHEYVVITFLLNVEGGEKVNHINRILYIIFLYD